MGEQWDTDRALRAMFTELRMERPGFARGMGKVIEFANELTGVDAWDHAQGIDWSGFGDAYVEWFDALLKEQPFPTRAEAVWFETPSDLNPAASLVNAFEKLGPADSDYGLDEGAIWPEQRADDEIMAGFASLLALEEAISATGFRAASHERREELAQGVAVMSAGCVCLLAMEAMERTDVLQQVIHRSGLAVFSGYASGGVIPIGQCKQSGWGPVRRVRPPSGRAYWDERAFWPGLNFERYLAAGGDPNLRDEGRSWRPSLLMFHAMFLTPADVDLLVKAGADVRAIDEDGRNVLHYCDSADPATVAKLIEHGADPNANTHRGGSVLLSVAWNRADVVRVLLEAGADPNPAPAGKEGLTPLDRASAHVVEPAMIRDMVNAGGKWNWAVRDGSTPLHKLAETKLLNRNCRSRLGPLIELYQQFGFDINNRDGNGMSPLWTALLRHCQELIEHLAWIEENGDRGGRWDHDHDLTAVRMLERGADPNERSVVEGHPLIPPGATPLMVGRFDDTRLVKALLKSGADPLALDAEGRAALDHVRAAQRAQRRYGGEACEEVAMVLERAARRKR
tara:strand:- start:2773 stop:4476 length:1704 start_codon:yes stop_codon:yes gene_type:complete